MGILAVLARIKKRLPKPGLRSKKLSTEKIIADFGAFLEHSRAMPIRIVDSTLLPHPKHVILDAFTLAVACTRDKQMQHTLRAGALYLAYFQPKIGKKPLEMLGYAIEDLPMFSSKDSDAIDASLKLISQLGGPGSPTRKWWIKFDQLVEKDMQGIRSRMEAAMRWQAFR